MHQASLVLATNFHLDCVACPQLDERKMPMGLERHATKEDVTITTGTTTNIELQQEKNDDRNGKTTRLLAIDQEAEGWPLPAKAKTQNMRK